MRKSIAFFLIALALSGCLNTNVRNMDVTEQTVPLLSSSVSAFEETIVESSASSPMPTDDTVVTTPAPTESPKESPSQTPSSSDNSSDKEDITPEHESFSEGNNISIHMRWYGRGDNQEVTITGEDSDAIRLLINNSVRSEHEAPVIGVMSAVEFTFEGNLYQILANTEDYEVWLYQSDDPDHYYLIDFEVWDILTKYFDFPFKITAGDIVWENPIPVVWMPSQENRQEVIVVYEDSIDLIRIFYSSERSDIRADVDSMYIAEVTTDNDLVTLTLETENNMTLASFSDDPDYYYLVDIGIWDILAKYIDFPFTDVNDLTWKSMQ